MLRESPPPLPIKTDDLPPRPALKEEREVLLASAPPPMLKVVPLVPGTVTASPCVSSLDEQTC